MEIDNIAPKIKSDNTLLFAFKIEEYITEVMIIQWINDGGSKVL